MKESPDFTTITNTPSSPSMSGHSRVCPSRTSARASRIVYACYTPVPKGIWAPHMDNLTRYPSLQ